jgi:hypothetical protein
MLDPATGLRRKILIFTEPKDTLEYLQQPGWGSLSEPPQQVEPNDCGAVTAKEDAGILGLKGFEAAIRCTLRIILWGPGKIACVKTSLHQADA